MYAWMYVEVKGLPVLLRQTQPPPPSSANGHQYAAVCPHSPLSSIIHAVLSSTRCNPLLRRHHKGWLWRSSWMIVTWHKVVSWGHQGRVLERSPRTRRLILKRPDFSHCWLPASTRLWLNEHGLTVQDVPIWAVFYVSVVLERRRENVPRFTACQICRMCTLNCVAQTGLVDPSPYLPTFSTPHL